MRPLGFFPILLAASLMIAWASSAIAHPLDDLQPGEWYEVPNSRMDAIRDCQTTYCPLGNFANIVDAWSGGTFDTTRNMLLVQGGGHNDYAGNEIYAFDVDTMSWSRFTEPSQNHQGAGDSNVRCVLSDGQPASYHTWDFMAHVPGVDKYFLFGCVGPYPNGGTGWGTCGLDMATKSWDCNSYPDLHNQGFAYGEPRGAHAIYDSGTGDVWIKLGGNTGTTRYLLRYDVSANTMSKHETTYHKWYTGAAIDPERRLFVWAGRQDNDPAFRVVDLDNPNTPSFTPSHSGSGASTVMNEDSPGFAFDSNTGKFVAWVTGSTVYTLEPPADPINGTWTWATVSSTGGSPPSGHALKGTNGRWQYVPAYNVFILVNGVNENVYFYRLASGGPPQVPPRPGNLTAN